MIRFRYFDFAYRVIILLSISGMEYGYSAFLYFKMRQHFLHRYYYYLDMYMIA